MNEQLLAEIAEEWGTPVYVYDESVIREQYSGVATATPYPAVDILYACKANSNLHILKLFQSIGAGLDAVSTGEVFLGLRARFPRDKILFTGNNVTDEEMDCVRQEGVLINIDSISQLVRYGRRHSSSSVSIRINPGIGAGHHSYVVTGGHRSKFGIRPEKIEEVKRIAAECKLRIVGLHMHIGSGILTSKPILSGLEVLLDVARAFDDLEFIDIGGGIGIPYKQEERAFDIAGFGIELGAIIGSWVDANYPVTLKLELGRFLVGDAGILLTRVNTIREDGDRLLIGVDTGFNHLIRPILYDAYHEIVVLGKSDYQATRVVDVCGNICESGDFLAQARCLPAVEEGALLAIKKVGAYGFSMSSNYNSRPRPAEVLFNSGTTTLIRRRETLEDLVRCIP